MNQTAICNLALLRLGITQQIADITENTVNGRACRAVYDPSIRQLLQEHPWPFATRQVDLALVDIQIIADYYYSYRYPTDFLMINRVLPKETLDDSVPLVSFTPPSQAQIDTYPFMIGSDSSGRLIHTEIEDAVAIGTIFIDDTSMFDQLFIDALAWRMSTEMAMAVTRNKDYYSLSKSNYEDAVSRAFAMGLNEPKPRPPRDASMIEARN